MLDNKARAAYARMAPRRIVVLMLGFVNSEQNIREGFSRTGMKSFGSYRIIERPPTVTAEPSQGLISSFVTIFIS